jgi:anti-sigma factor RsiW
VSCREFADFIADYLSGELAAPIREQFDQHLSVCVNCVRYLDGYRATIALGKAAFDNSDESVPAEVPEDLVKAILNARR